MDSFGSGTETRPSSWSQVWTSTRSADFNWDVFVRAGLLSEAVGALLNGPGVLIDGSVGSGRKTMASAILRQLQGKTLIIDLGFPERHRATFEFRKIVDQIEDFDEESRFNALSTAHSMLQREAAGLPIVVFVPETLSLGPHAASFLSALTLSNTVSLLCLSTMLPTAEHQEQDDLLGSVRLHRIRLNPLTLNETHHRLSLALGDAVSRSTAHQLWRASAGQLHLISALAQDWYEQGYLLKSGNAWVVKGTGGHVGPRSRAIWAQLVSRTQGAERDVIELLSLSEEIPLSSLMSVCDAEVVDALYAKGLVEIQGNYPRAIRLSRALNEQVVADTTPPGKARELLARYLSVNTNGSLLKPVARLQWEQKAGLESECELVLEAAQQALAERKVELCLEILGEGLVSAHEIEILRLEALIYGGFLEHASEKLKALRAKFVEGIPNPDAGVLPDALLCGIRLEMAAARMQVARNEWQGAQIYAGFSAIRDRIEAWASSGLVENQQLKYLSGQLDLIESESLYRVGERPWVNDLPYVHPNLRVEDQLRWQSFHNFHSVRSGHVQLALKRGEELVLMLQQDSLPEDTKQSIRQHLADLYLISGEWNKALALVDASWSGGEESPRITERSGLYSSLVYVFTGRGQDALKQLLIETEQLRTADPDAQLPLAIAAAALAASHIDESVAVGFLAELELMPRNWNWETLQAIAVLRAVGEFNLGAKETATRILRESAQANAVRGALNLELTSRMMLLRVGYKEETEKLLACAGKIDGSLAATVVSLVKNLDQIDDSERARAVEEIWSMGHKAFVETMGTRDNLHNHQNEGPRANKPFETFAVAEMNGSKAKDGSALALLTSLTNRQKMIVAEAVTGASSRDISERLEIGVRTVEGHLYQIYQRLHVSSRLELEQLYFDASAPEVGSNASRRGT